MKIGIIGASGKAGSAILHEAQQRGHAVTAIVRNKSKVSDALAVLEKDVFDLTAADLAAFDVVVDAFGAPPEKSELHQTSLAHLVHILKNTPVRLMIVGGASSLYVDDAKTTYLLDTPDFPKAYFPTASNMKKALEALKPVKNVNWTYISPAAFFNPDGARTGKYQVSDTRMKLNQRGNSEISYRDYAIAMLDEIEHPKHRQTQISVVSE